MRSLIAIALCTFLTGCISSQTPPSSSRANTASPALAAEARITIAFVPGSGRLTRTQLDASDFPGEGVLKIGATVRRGQQFDSLFHATGLSEREFSIAVARVTINPRLLGSIQVVRVSPQTGKREIITYRSHGFPLNDVFLTDGDCIVAREVTGY